MVVPALELAPLEGQRMHMRARGEPTGGSRSGRPQTGSSGGGTLVSSCISSTVNESNTRLFGDFLRRKILSCVAGSGAKKDPSRTLVGKAFRHLHRGEGHILTFDEFRDGLAHAFGARLQPNIIRATFDLFDSDPRTWQVDLDEFCHWLDTGRRELRDNGISDIVPVASAAGQGHHQSRRLERRPSVEQLEREKMKEHFVKHRSRLHTSKLTDAQKGLVDLMLLERIKAKIKVPSAVGCKFDTLKAFQKLCRHTPSGRLTYGNFSREAESLLPDLVDEDELSGVFSRMDANSDGVVDLTDFMVWVDAVGEGRSGDRKRQAGDSFWALEEEENLRRLTNSHQAGSNPLVPEDYDGSTWIAKLGRNKSRPHSHSCRSVQRDNELRSALLSRAPGGAQGLLRSAFRHFRPAGVGRKLFVEYSEFRDSIKQQGLGIGEPLIKEVFQHFDAEGSGEIDFAEFRQWLLTTPPSSDPHPAEQVLRDKVLSKVSGGQAEILRAFQTFKAPGNAGRSMLVTPRSFDRSLDQLGLHELGEEDRRTLFGKFDVNRSGEIDFEEFRNWLTAGNTRTGLSTSKPPRSRRTASELHHLLREKVVGSISGGPHELLRAFRKLTRTKSNTIDASDLREAAKSLGISAVTEDQSRELFDLYDRRRAGRIQFQELVEIIVENQEPPKALTRAEREALWRKEMMPEDELSSLESRLRSGLQDLFRTRTHECFAALDVAMQGAVGPAGIKEALQLVGIQGVDDRAMRQLLARYSQGAERALCSPQEAPPTWRYRDFCSFYRVSEVQDEFAGGGGAKGDAPARSRPSRVLGAPLPAEVLRAQAAAAAAAARRPSSASSVSIKAKLLGQVYGRWKKILRTFQGLDSQRTGLVSREDFKGVLRMTQGLHRLSEQDVSMLMLKHARMQNSRHMVAYSEFLKSYLVTLKAFDLPPAGTPRALTPAQQQQQPSSLLRPSTAGSLGGYSKRGSGSSSNGGIHNAMRGDVLKYRKQLAKDLKERESPYRRGIVSLKDFEEAFRRNGLPLDEDDLTQLLGAHQHRSSRSGASSSSTGKAAAAAEPHLKYKEFMRCVSSAALPALDDQQQLAYPLRRGGGGGGGGGAAAPLH